MRGNTIFHSPLTEKLMDRFVQRNVGTILPDVPQGKVKVYLIKGEGNDGIE